MIIVKPSAELVNPLPYNTMLDTVEKAIRNCYRSEDKIKEGSAENIIRGCLTRGHESPLEFGDITVKLIGSRSLLAQITRHRLASFCISGDTIVQSFSNDIRKPGKTLSVKELYTWATDFRYKRVFSQLLLQSMNEAGQILPNRPINVYYNGKKPVFELKTESGKEIKATADHKFFSQGGQKSLQELVVGDSIYIATPENTTFLDKILSITPLEVEDVYDIEMNSPYHNFVANGFVVHNCVESQRYVNYSKDKFEHEIKVVVPEGLNNEAYETWRASVLVSEAAYMLLIDNFCIPAEIARSVLPNCTATTIYMKANIREWRYIFNLRADNHAQQEIRELMTDLLKQCYKKYPVFFEDLYKKFCG